MDRWLGRPALRRADVAARFGRGSIPCFVMAGLEPAIQK